MAASTTLRMFPQPADQSLPNLRVRTANGKQPEQTNPASSLMAAASCGLNGVSFEVTDYSDISPIVINSAANHIKYSMTRSISPRPVSAGLGNNALSPVADNSPMTPVSRPELPPSPVSPHFSTPNRMPSHRLARSSGSIHRQEAMRSSPLSQRSNESSSPTLVRRNSDATERADTPMQTYPIKSVFPQLEAGIPLTQQPNRTVDDSTSRLPRQQIGKATEVASCQALPQPLSIQVPERQTQHVLPALASSHESIELWNLANGDLTGTNLDSVHFDIKCCTVRNGQRSITRPGLDLDVVDAAGTKLYMARLAQSSAMHGSRESCNGDLNVQRCHPEEQGTFPVAQMDSKLPIEGFSNSEEDDGVARVTSIFPQVAALNAIKSVADSLQARSIAQFDPSATSPQAAQLAFDAVQNAKESEEANLVYRMPSQASSSSAGRYELQHPIMGPLSISVTGRNNLFDLGGTGYKGRSPIEGGKIALRGQSLRTGHTEELVTLDLESERLSVNVRALRDLESRFMIDTAICTVLSVAITESFRPENGGYHTYFAAPPGTPRGLQRKVQRCSSVRSISSKCSSTKRKGLFRRSSKDKTSTTVEEKDADSIKLPPVTKGLLKLLGFSFDAIVWVLSLGVKLLVKLVSCMAGGKSK
ncbi:Nucleolar complex-associated protein 3 [Sphaceloma murrayae]|uniref:Nucleolar complex-associated protein 3 n=1 Tax=Sphaceloma murrayae TaxID=2082308 RepID=A0A2K1QKS2_9PEZI|nr:Nucleolar complex-associated protein 3 [Sphaceloma murrayae]